MALHSVTRQWSLSWPGIRDILFSTPGFLAVILLTSCGGGGGMVGSAGVNGGGSTNGGGGVSGGGVSSGNLLTSLFQWVWQSGSSTPNTNSTTQPSSRISGATWTLNGTLWLFGGETYSGNDANDLWTYSPSTRQWTSLPSTAPSTAGVYGTRNQPSPTNWPGARNDMVTWTDASNNLWMFGGYGEGSNGLSQGSLNDLWSFNATSKQWTWVSGSPLINQASTTAMPGARYASVSWLDPQGNLWLFGGTGYAQSTLTSGELNDLWKFVPSTQQWTLVSGSNTTLNQEGTAATPGARHDATSWIDLNGHLWLMGGHGYAQYNSTPGELSDLWEFNPTTLQWTLHSTASTILNQPGVYGGTGVPSTQNHPGSRDSAASWTDTSGNFWLFGGFGYDGSGNEGILNDLWKYTPSTGEWAWVNGSSVYDQIGSYGSSPGTPGFPGARSSADSWYVNGSNGTSGSLWLFGGWDAHANYYNDLWQYTP